MNILQLDLDEEFALLEDAGMKKNKLTAQCTFCQATVKQEMNQCPECKVPVVWFESSIWRRLWGKPEDYIRHLTSDHLKGTTPLQMEVIKVYGHLGRFKNVTQQRVFLSIEKKYPDGFIKHVLEWARGKHVPWGSFVSAVKNDSWLAQWSKKEMDNIEERWAGVSDEAVQSMLG